MFDLLKNVVRNPFGDSYGPDTDRIDRLIWEASTWETLSENVRVGTPWSSLAVKRCGSSISALSRCASPFSFPFVLLCGALILASTPPAAFADEKSSLASLTELRGQVSQLLRSESVAKDQQTKQQTLTALCDLYVVLRKDARYATSEMLQQDAGKIRRRLLTAAGSITARQRRLKIPRPDNLRQSVDDAIEAAHDSLRDSAAKGGGRSGSSGLDLYALSQPERVVGPERGRQAAGAFDNGWQLVELIQRIVAPDFWQDSGGPGTVTYFAMRRVLVVRATSDVHEQIRDLLLSLPR
jgi:hypothetical protein